MVKPKDKLEKPPWFNRKMLAYQTWEPFNNQIKKVPLDDSTLSDTWFETVKLKSNVKPTYLVISNKPVGPVEIKEVKRLRSYKKKEVTLPLRTKIVKLNPSQSDRVILHHTFNITRKIWNECVDYYNKERPNRIGLRDAMRTALVKGKTCGIIEREPKLLAAMKKVDSDIRRDVVDRFVDAVMNNFDAKKAKRIKHFKMNYRLKKDGAPSIYLAHNKISDKIPLLTFYPNSLGKASTLFANTVEPIPPINHDCRLVWDHLNDEFYFHISIEQETTLSPSNHVCALDPGVRIFNTIYGSDGVAYLVANYSAKRIVKLCRIANRMRHGIERKGMLGDKYFVKSRHHKKRYKLKLLARTLETKVKHLVKETHCKLVHFLCKRYKTIIIPDFRVQPMIEREKRDPSKPPRKINRKTAFIMARWSHHAFRKRLIAKGEIEGTNVIVGTEEYTSKTCSACFSIKDNLGGAKKYNCLVCHNQMHRDINAARNIMIRNWELASLYNKRSPKVIVQPKSTNRPPLPKAVKSIGLQKVLSPLRTTKKPTMRATLPRK